MAPPIPDPRKWYLSPNRSNGVKHKVVNSKSELGKLHMKPSSNQSNHGFGVVAVHSSAQETQMNGSDFTSAHLHPNSLLSRVQEKIWTIRPSNGWPISAHESWFVCAQHLWRRKLHSRPSKHHQTDQARKRSSDGSSNASSAQETQMNGSDFTSAHLYPDRLLSRVQEKIWTIRLSNGWPISARESWFVRAQHLWRTKPHSRLSKHHQTNQARKRSSDRSSNACPLTKYSNHGGGGVSVKNKDNTGAYPSSRETSVTVGKSLERTTTGRGESVDNTRGDVSFGNTNIEAGNSFKGKPSIGKRAIKGGVKIGTPLAKKPKSGRTLDGLDSQQTVVTRTQKYEEYRRLRCNIGDRYNRWFCNLEYGYQKWCKGNNCEHNNGGGSRLVAVARILGWCFDWVGGKYGKPTINRRVVTGK